MTAYDRLVLRYDAAGQGSFCDATRLLKAPFEDATRLLKTHSEM